MRFLRDISSYLLIFLFVLCYWYCSVHSLGWLPGGELSIQWSLSDGHMYMTGPTVTVYDGQIAD